MKHKHIITCCGLILNSLTILLQISFANINLDNNIDSDIEKNGLFDCQSLYLTNYNSRPTIRKVLLDENGIPTGKTEILYRTDDTTYASTIALRRPGGKNSGNPLRMYGWDYVGSVRFSYVDADGTQFARESSKQSKFTTFAGGEVNQLTGEIYLSGDAVGYMRNIQYAIWDPIKNTVTRSAKGLNLKYGTLDRGTSAWKSYVSSDMAIDAEGHFYSIVGKRWLIKVERGENGQKWLAEEIGELPDLILKASGHPTDGGALHDIWGMAFLNGKLYVSTYKKDIHVISPLTLKVIASSTLTDNLGPGIDTIYDFASCQVAPIIRGTVYRDPSGDGKESTFEPLAGQVVELWKNGTFITSRMTKETGTYVFLVDDIDKAEYKIIIRNSQINNQNAYQTWASAKDAVNGTTAFCATENNTIEKRLKSGLCQDFMEGEDTIVKSEIIMSTDSIVAIADFALTTAKLRQQRISIHNIL